MSAVRNNHIFSFVCFLGSFDLKENHDQMYLFVSAEEKNHFFVILLGFCFCTLNRRWGLSLETVYFVLCTDSFLFQ